MIKLAILGSAVKCFTSLCITVLFARTFCEGQIYFQWHESVVGKCQVGCRCVSVAFHSRTWKYQKKLFLITKKSSMWSPYASNQIWGGITWRNCIYLKFNRNKCRTTVKKLVPLYTDMHLHFRNTFRVW